MLSKAKHLAFSSGYEVEILRLRLRMTLRHSLQRGRRYGHGGEGEDKGASWQRSGLAVFWSFALFLIFFIFSPASAQVPPLVAVPFPVDPTGRSGEPPTLPKQFEAPTPPPGTLLPPAQFHRRGPFPDLRVFVREIRVNGSTIFSAEELAKVTAPYLNREVTSEDLEALRVALTLLYVNNGYVNSGAILPDQTVSEGVVTYQIIEGGLTAVDVEGNRWFRSSYFQKRFLLDAGPPLNVNALQRRLQLMLEDSRIQRLNAELKPGLQRGEGILDVRVEERTPYDSFRSTTTTSHPLWERTVASSPYGMTTSLATEMCSLGNPGNPKVSIRCSISSMRSRSTPMTRL